MSYQLEVCIDNIESLAYAIAGGATRIELCSSLALGGLTPNAGLIKQAVQSSSIPIYVMIRPRQGDFLYDCDDVEIMAEDIRTAAKYGASGVVLGLLDKEGHVDMPRSIRLVKLARELDLGVTFHRAFDQCRHPEQALEDVIALGCERILTSGLAASASEGVATLSAMVKQAEGRIAIMAGAGVSSDNVASIIASSGVNEVHLSGKSTRQSKMYYIADDAKMGASDIDDFAIPITSSEKIRAVTKVLNSL
ncbi:copper homeostasis protein CutC [Vibrio sp. SCSIO 43140]|uniref:copper homeostasis protein CutC n=1 Tax=Vibrio sp. SCSIO 43140 TaxID=2819100 RepID=UPI0020763D10|nr:copper homeostasis protein CutC [Vibrio sp. SCSIO 43140]USD60989.1 copper homeostasis protein CutC [Vibrio sp. SCSIO 43140]